MIAVLDRVGAALAVVGLAVLAVGALIGLTDGRADVRPAGLLVVAALAVAVTRVQAGTHRRRVRTRPDPGGSSTSTAPLCHEPEPEDRVTLARGERWTCGRRVGHDGDHAVVQGTRVVRVWPRGDR